MAILVAMCACIILLLFSHQVTSVISQQQKVSIKFKVQPEPEMDSVIGVCPL